MEMSTEAAVSHMIQCETTVTLRSITVSQFEFEQIDLAITSLLADYPVAYLHVFRLLTAPNAKSNRLQTQTMTPVQHCQDLTSY